MTKGYWTAAQEKKLAKALDKEFDLPIVGGGAEFKIWAKFVDAVDKIIGKMVQDEFLDTQNDASLTLEAALGATLKANLAPLLADKLNVPIIPFALKVKLIEFLLDLMIKAMCSATTLDEVVDTYIATGEV